MLAGGPTVVAPPRPCRSGSFPGGLIRGFAWAPTIRRAVRSAVRSVAVADELQQIGRHPHDLDVALAVGVVTRCYYSTMNSASMPWLKWGGASISSPLSSAAASASGVDPTGKKQRAP